MLAFTGRTNAMEWLVPPDRGVFGGRRSGEADGIAGSCHFDEDVRLSGALIPLEGDQAPIGREAGIALEPWLRGQRHHIVGGLGGWRRTAAQQPPACGDGDDGEGGERRPEPDAPHGILRARWFCLMQRFHGLGRWFGGGIHCGDKSVPAPRDVSTWRGVSAESESAWRRRVTAAFSPRSKSRPCHPAKRRTDLPPDYLGFSTGGQWKGCS